MTNTLMEELLHASEGTTLDVKQSQYPWVGASDGQRSELLKDILAFTNAWKTGPAYILIGVRQGKGRHEVVGTDDHPFDDAALQQFVNSKTNRVVTLSYEVLLYEGKKVGVITIPKQQRPVHVKRDYCKVKKYVVYYRLGSSTATASPEIIAKMGAGDEVEQNSVPVLSLDLVDPQTRQVYGSSISLVCVAFAKEGILPRFSGGGEGSGSGSGSGSGGHL